MFSERPIRSFKRKEGDNGATPPRSALADAASINKPLTHMYEISDHAEFERDCLAIALAMTVDHMASIGNRLAPTQILHLAEFHDHRLPHLPLQQFVFEFSRNSDCSSAALAFALVYLSRFCCYFPLPVVTSSTVHRMLLTCLVLAIKFVDDRVMLNAHYATIGHVTLHHLNRCENLVLKRLGWSLFVNKGEYGHSRMALDGIVQLDVSRIFKILSQFRQDQTVPLCLAVSAEHEESVDIEDDSIVSENF
eukprot:c431_g1_i1.p1 GENE.c431_g1_i1~~c431_g1_i1.p1  ORF type:complete len:250 (+),score=47.57 c431_g1_i1:88-837(+)